MNKADPITNQDDVKEMKQYLKEWNDMYYVLFLTGIYTGFRISDILQLRVKDVKGWNIKVREKKTKKEKEVKMAPELKREMRKFVEGKPLNQFIFKSRQGKNRPITRQRVNQILEQAAFDLGIDGTIATHSMRKTFGYFYYKKHRSVQELMRIFNHSTESITLDYIGDKQEQFNKNMSNFHI